MMKRYQVEITKYAYKQMRDIARYVKSKLKNPDAAKRLLNDLKTAAISLEKMPHRIPLTDEQPWRSEGIRKMPVKNYLKWKCNSNSILAVRQKNPILNNKIEQKYQFSKFENDFTYSGFHKIRVLCKIKLQKGTRRASHEYYC